MATHSTVLAWRIPGMGEPGGLPSVGLHRVGHDWSDLAVYKLGFPNGSVAKNLTSIQEPQKTRVWSLGREDPLEEGIATHSSILAWRIPWTEEPGKLQSMGLQVSQRVGHSWATKQHHQQEELYHRNGKHYKFFLLTLESQLLNTDQHSTI